MFWTCFSYSHWAAISAADIDKLGSFLQGLFSPIAFLWLVIGYFLQRKDLELQRVELRENNVSQREQHNALARQADLFAEQLQMARAQSDADRDMTLIAQNIMIGPEDATSGPVLTFELMNLGATVYSVYLQVSCDGPVESKLATRSMLSYLVPGTPERVILRPSPAGDTFPNISVVFLRNDGRRRRAEYTLDIANQILVPRGISDDIQPASQTPL